MHSKQFRAIAIALIAAESNHHSSHEMNSHSSQIEAWSALLNGLLLLGIAAFIPWKVIEPIQTPETSAGLPMLILAALGFLVKGVNATLLYKETHHSLNVRGVFNFTRSRMRSTRSAFSWQL